MWLCPRSVALREDEVLEDSGTLWGESELDIHRGAVTDAVRGGSGGGVELMPTTPSLTRGCEGPVGTHPRAGEEECGRCGADETIQAPLPVGWDRKAGIGVQRGISFWED